MFKKIINLAQTLFQDQDCEDRLVLQALEEAIRHSEDLLKEATK